MTRFLSQALEASEPTFRNGLMSLEQAHGRPNHDIRLTTEILHATQNKLRSLGLDPADTTPKELYHVLLARLEKDDAKLIKTLRTAAATHISAEGDIVEGMIHTLKQLPQPKFCFALKPAKLKSLIRQLPPKKTIKKLGYRSLESCLKHESVFTIVAAAELTEGKLWQARFHALYKTLNPSDFEMRQTALVKMDIKRWPASERQALAGNKHNLICLKELGTIIFLPLPQEIPAGAVTASMTLALHNLNEIRASSTYLQLAQVRADFGQLVRQVAENEPQLKASLLSQPVSWQLIHRFYAEAGHKLEQTMFEPHLNLSDIVWKPVTTALAAIEPSLAFWYGTESLGYDSKNRPVSLNVLDTALNLCNKVPFEKRLTHYFKSSLWHQLLLRYLKPKTVEQSVVNELQPELATAIDEVE